jgi:ubiquinone/menaquinone biosynthesis C-methylase UbiE
MNRKLLILPVLALLTLLSAKSKPEFSYKIYGNVANYFHDEKELLNFFDFNKGDVVAEIGAYEGGNIAGLSIMTDSMTFYVQDIDRVHLNEKKFQKLLSRAEKYKTPLTNKFQLCYGTVSESNLPDNSFDKIILISTFHEFTHMNEMIYDIYKKLKPNGQLYILDTHCFTPTHKNYSSEDIVLILNKHKFHLLKQDGNDNRNSTGLYRLIFKK